MLFGASEIILFGVKAGVRLYGQARQAYVEGTRQRELVIPLPGLDREATAERARGYFAGSERGRQHVAASPRLSELHAKAMADLEVFTGDHPAEAAEYRDLFAFHLSDDSGVATEQGLLGRDVVALNTIAQWRGGDTPHPTALRRIAGTVVEIGIDYFAGGPGQGKLAGDSPATALLREVLNALDDHSFVSEGLEIAVQKVVLCTLDLMTENPALISGDPRLQRFVAGVAGGVVGDLQQRLEALPEHERLFAADRLGETARAVFRSVVRNGAEEVLERPNTYLGTAAGGESVLAARLGTIILDTVLPEGAERADFGALITGDALDELVKGALYVVAEHPELMGADEPELARILQEVAGELAAETARLGPDLFASVARLVLETTAENLEILWSPGLAGGNLAVTGVKTLLTGLARPPVTGRWHPQLSQGLVLQAVEATLDELAENPGLVTRQVAGRPALEAAVTAVLDGLAAQQLAGFSAATATGILTLALRAAAERWEVLVELPGDPANPRLALTGIVDTVLAAAAGAGEPAVWLLAQDRILVPVFEIVFAKLTESGVSEENLAKARAVLDQLFARLAAGGPFSLESLAGELKARLAA